MRKLADLDVHAGILKDFKLRFNDRRNPPDTGVSVLPLLAKAQASAQNRPVVKVATSKACRKPLRPD